MTELAHKPVQGSPDPTQLPDVHTPPPPPPVPMDGTAQVYDLVKDLPTLTSLSRRCSANQDRAIGACRVAPRDRSLSGSALSLSVPARHVVLKDPGEPAGCMRPVPSPAAQAFTHESRVRHSRCVDFGADLSVRYGAPGAIMIDSDWTDARLARTSCRPAAVPQQSGARRGSRYAGCRGSPRAR